MNSLDISQAKNPDLRASLAALQRASETARKVAIQTDTALIIVQDGKLTRLTASQLRQQPSEQLKS